MNHRKYIHIVFIIYLLLNSINVLSANTVPIECNKLVNASFEKPVFSGQWRGFNASQVLGWSVDRGTVEIWNNFTNYPSKDGNHHLELNGTYPSTIFQDVATTPGVTMAWSFWHRSRSRSNETVRVIINGVNMGNFTTSGSSWRQYSGTYTIPSGQTTTRFSIKAISPSGSVGNLIDDAYFGVQASSNNPNITLSVPDNVCADQEFTISTNISNGLSPYSYEFSTSGQAYVQSTNNTYSTNLPFSESLQSIKVRVTDKEACIFVVEKNIRIHNKTTTNPIIKMP